MGSFFRPPVTRSSGTTPVIFDILAPDGATSMLPDGLKFMFNVNPSSISLSYNKGITPIQTMGGFVEFHWGNALQEVSFENVFGGFVRVKTGVSAVTNNAGQGRRQTLAYNNAMDYLALFHNNGAIYDSQGTLVVQGFVQLTFEPGVYLGWIHGDISINEDATKPFSLAMSSKFVVTKEIINMRSTQWSNLSAPIKNKTHPISAQEGLFDGG